MTPRTTKFEHGPSVGGEVVEEEHADPVRRGGEDGRQRSAGVGQDVLAPPAALAVDDVHLGVEEEEEVKFLKVINKHRTSN